MTSPAVYRFVCPDGRSYVGAVGVISKRGDHGIARSNPRLLAAFEQHLPEDWTFEVLERLHPGCSKRELREAEQRHIDALRSWSPEAGFNIYPAIWEGEGSAQRAGRQWKAAIWATSCEEWAARPQRRMKPPKQIRKMIPVEK